METRHLVGRPAMLAAVPRCERQIVFAATRNQIGITGMKKLVPLLAALVLTAAAALAADLFSKQLSPEEYARAGLGKLSPRELSELDGLFQKYGQPGTGKSTASPPPLVPPPPTQAKKSEPAPPPPRAEAAPKGVAQTPTVKADDSDQGFIRLRKAAPAPKKDVVVISTEVDGTFAGWEETTVWTMKDGSIWRVDNRPRPYVAPKVSSPRVRITPALLNGYWIDFVDLGVRVRAVRLK
jgi:hypothetical protein